MVRMNSHWGSSFSLVLISSAFESYIKYRQTEKLKRNEMPEDLDLIKKQWDVTEEEIKKSNHYSLDKMYPFS